jgi:hypothetical protein
LNLRIKQVSYIILTTLARVLVAAVEASGRVWDA